MIKLEHVVLASPEQMEFIIEGMRNPMNSWEKSDSDSEIKYESWHDMSGGKYEIGPNDHSLMQRSRLALLLIVAVPCIRFRLRNLDLRISVVNI